MLITALHAGAGAACSVWAAAHAAAMSHPPPALPPWMAGLAGAWVLGAIGFWLGLRVFPAGPGRLSWDGAAWWWHSEVCNESPVPLQRLVVALDGGAWVLLRLMPAGGLPARWRVASAAGVGAAWHGLRVALQAHAGDPHLPDDQAPEHTTRGPGATP